MPEVGDKYSFIPSAFHEEHSGMMLQNFRPDMDLTVCGTVTEVHEDRHWFRVQYETHYGIQYECFKY